MDLTHGQLDDEYEAYLDRVTPGRAAGKAFFDSLTAEQKELYDEWMDGGQKEEKMQQGLFAGKLDLDSIDRFLAELRWSEGLDAEASMLHITASQLVARVKELEAEASANIRVGSLSPEERTG